MPRLTFPITTDGLALPTVICLDSPAMQALQAKGKPLPVPISVRGMLDSGTTVTGVVPRVLTALGAVSGASSRTQTVAGPAATRFYRISFTIHSTASGSTVPFSRWSWLVTSLPNDLPDMDVLFGMDLLHELILTVDGPSGFFALDF
jgi:hypothetical protein